MLILKFILLFVIQSIQLIVIISSTCPIIYIKKGARHLPFQGNRCGRSLGPSITKQSTLTLVMSISGPGILFSAQTSTFRTYTPELSIH
jgi:hypothetical protein